MNSRSEKKDAIPTVDAPETGSERPASLPPLTDSGWFWAFLFSLMALVGIAVISPKWDWRQRQLEGRYLGREQAAAERQRRAEGLAPVDLADTAADRDAVAPGRIVPAWTLTTLAAAAAAGSAAMLYRERLAASQDRGFHASGAASPGRLATQEAPGDE